MDGSTPRPSFVLRGKRDIDTDAVIAKAFTPVPQAGPDEPYPELLDEAMAAAVALKVAYIRADDAAARAYSALSGGPFGQKAAALSRAVRNLRLPGEVLYTETWERIQRTREGTAATAAYMARQSAVTTVGD